MQGSDTDSFAETFELVDQEPFELIASLIIETFRNEALQDALVHQAARKEPAPAAAPEPKPPGSLLSTEEAAAFLGISTESLRRLCRRKAVTFIRVTADEYRFHPDDLAEFVNSRRNKRKSVFKGPK
jgi:excisionase family DNA binding protein